ncbi:MAG: SDR family oxidoreductase, partial [Bacteroidetes bacterium]|nr:SDR family oxidoreductase [Bacteroidota bacterium]
MLKNKVALVTGGSRGIGAAIAAALAREGARVVLAARNADALAETAAMMRDADTPAVLTAAADIAQPEAVDRLFARIHDELGAVDVLVANAGVQGPIGPLEDASPHAFAETIAVNLTGVWLCMRAAIPGMKRSGRGKIITLSGGGATGPRERFAVYAAAKAAVVRLTETAAAELRSFGIDVNAIAPGAVNTRMLDEVLEAGARAGGELDAARKRADEGGTPPERAAELAVFLASSASDGISGKLLSAVWDPWRDVDFVARLRSDPDFATLRRIDE